MKVRPARTDDAQSIAVLLSELGYPTTPDEVPARLAGHKSPNYAVLLAEVHGEVVALIGLRRAAFRKRAAAS